MEEQAKELKDYIDTFRRRRKSILSIVGGIFVISVVAALLWPPTYRSMATILIEEQDIPAEMVRSTITTYAWQRIQTISQRVMTRNNLLEIVNKYDLYPTKRKYKTNEEIIELMRDDIKLDQLSADVIDPRTGRPTPATIAFTLSYDGASPTVTQKVANELTTLYLNENIKSRTEKASEAYDFLTDEANKLSEQISELEKKLAEFKEKNLNRLPELSLMNMQLMDRAESELRELDNQARSIEEKKFYLQGQLAQIQPSGPTISSDGERVPDLVSRLKALKTQYASASAKYSSDHPDVLNLKREIDGIEKQTGAVSQRQEHAKELARIRGELAAAREKYSADHPDVIRLTKQVAALESSLKAEPLLPEESAAAEKPDNPAYLTIKAQLEGFNADSRSLLAKREEIRKKLANYENRITQTPQVEREYLNLKRDYENAQVKYKDIKAKQMEAEVSQSLEKERKGERFSLIDPPQLPEEPAKPNRPAIILLGLILSVGTGLGYGVVAESMDTTVRNANSITTELNTTLLSVIPYRENQEDISKRVKLKKRFLTVIAVSVVVAIVLAHFLWTPLDVLWFKGIRKAGAIVGS